MNFLSAKRADEAKRDSSPGVSDEDFIIRVYRYRTARTFLVEGGARFSVEHQKPLDLTDLYSLRLKPFGPPATREQWGALEAAEQILATYFTPDLRRSLRIQKSRVIIGQWPLVFLFGAIVSYLAAVVLTRYVVDPSEANIFNLGAFIVWTISLGGLGAAAFLAVNSLGIQSDTSFDVGDKALIFMRLVVGSLFGFILSLPVSLPEFREFALDALVPRREKREFSIVTIAIILLPFFLGFSTSLVLSVMNRFVGAIETFFGVKPATQSSPSQP